MRDRFADNFWLTQQHSVTWLDGNPLSVPTERELYVQNKNLPVYRVLFQKLSSKN
jgi:tRNA (guanine-N7-)-methyltransferase